jgi:hypothetical protein
MYTGIPPTLHEPSLHHNIMDVPFRKTLFIPLSPAHSLWIRRHRSPIRNFLFQWSIQNHSPSAMDHHRTFSADDKMAIVSRSHVSAAPETTNITNESFTPESETVSPPISPRIVFLRRRSKSDAAIFAAPRIMRTVPTNRCHPDCFPLARSR